MTAINYAWKWNNNFYVFIILPLFFGTHLLPYTVVASSFSIHSDIESKASKGVGLPLYDMKPRDVKAPPAYDDALNDKLADQEEDVIDDRAPLNPWAT